VEQWSSGAVEQVEQVEIQDKKNPLQSGLFGLLVFI
jgi:hypothetical protein